MVGLVVASAAAQQHPTRPGVPVSDFWREVQTPGVRRAGALLRHGLRQLTQALRIDDREQRELTLEGAVARLRRAHELAPDDVDVLYFLAFASSQRQLVQRQADAGAAVREAIALYEELRARDEDYEAESVAFELGLLHTRLRHYGRAVEEYERGILRAFDPRSTVSAHANMAEVIMLNGDAALALRHYDRAAEVARQYAGDPTSLALALWGGAVASDRLGEGTAALERAGVALNASGGDMSALRQNGVFFEPESEIHWYEGLGALALAETASDREERLLALRRALRSFQTYLAEVETPATWDRVVEGRVRQIEQQIATLTAGGQVERGAGEARGRRPRPGRRP
jgi:tetratricopeptide (TPR) repeat protein